MLLTIMSIKNLQARKYQEDLDADIQRAWAAGARNVLAVLPTGGGKTFLFTGVLARETGVTCAIAHRKELVSQISLALNKRRVQHFVIAPTNTIKWIVSLHAQEHGESYYNPSARCAVAGVDTIMARADKMAEWCKQVSLWVQDEAHHLLVRNKWGKVSQMFTNARGLLVTATPERSDGKGLGRHADGLVDAMVVGPSARELITAGYLTDYRVFAPLSNIDLTGVEISSTGDFNQKQLVSKVRQSRIVGDVVGSYLKFAAGKLGITFATDVQTAEEITAAYVAAGVPAEMVSANTPDAIRANATAKLRRGDLKQLVNVDIFGEGFDLPAIEVVSFARPTESYVLYCQQFGRGLRPMPGKSHALIIDHVGNILRHGLPDAPRAWTLNARERRSATRKELPLRICAECTGVYERFYKVCPYCGYTHVPAGRSKPEFVDGDLTEMDPAVLEQMRAQVARLDAPFDKSKMRYAGAPEIAIAGAAKQHRLRQEAQTALRDAIAMWGGTQRHHGRPDYESYRRFYYQFGIDVLSAQALGRPEAEQLTERVRMDL